MSDRFDSAQGDLPEELARRRRVLFGELRARTLWLVRLRWWVPPAVAVGTLAARPLGFVVPAAPLLGVAGLILAYNVLFHLARRGKVEDGLPRTSSSIRRFTYLQLGLDYLALFLLIHLTGGIASPLVVFAIFHVVFAAILLPVRPAYAVAGAVSGCLALLGAGEQMGWLPHRALLLGGREVDLLSLPGHLAVEIAFLSAAVLATTFIATSIAAMLRRRIEDLADLSEAAVAHSERLEALYAVTQAIGARRHLDEVLTIATAELRRVVDVKGMAVKLLDEDGRELRYAAADGLPESLTSRELVELDRSAVNRRVVEGEPYVNGHVGRTAGFQHGDLLEQAGIVSVLLVPLRVEGRVLGILGAYCSKPDRFDDQDVTFLRLCADVVALAIESARAYEALERHGEERARFMHRVAHNMRAPLAAVISMLEVVRGAHFGPLSERQAEYLRRVDRRLRSMAETVSELMVLAASRSATASRRRVPVSLEALAGRVRRTFEEPARERGVELDVATGDGLRPVPGDPNELEQALDNLLSNAVKYTPRGGRVSVRLSTDDQGLGRIEVTDTGIGIPEADQPRLFSEFFRADNARETEEAGTGLGLAIVKDVVDRHGGTVEVASRLGEGTTVVVRLPTDEEESHERGP